MFAWYVFGGSYLQTVDGKILLRIPHMLVFGASQVVQDFFPSNRTSNPQVFGRKIQFAPWLFAGAKP